MTIPRQPPTSAPNLPPKAPAPSTRPPVPLAANRSAAAPALERANRSTATANGDGGPTRVLVVDDHAQLAVMTGLALEWAGYSVEIAHLGWRALARAERFRPAVVVCDLYLPDIDGFEVARRLRSAAFGRSLVLVACSGETQDDGGAGVRAAGFDAFLLKPVDIQQLLATIGAAGVARPAARD